MNVEPGKGRLGHVEDLEMPFLYRLANEMIGHVAPAKARQQKIEPGAEIGEPPRAGADDAAREAIADRGSVGKDELHLGLEVRPGDRSLDGGEGMVAERR